jgi:hypothetical protein
LSSHHNPYKNRTVPNMHPRSTFAQSKVALSRWEAKRLVEKTTSLSEASEAICDATAPSVNVALATRILFKQIKRRRS